MDSKDISQVILSEVTSINDLKAYAYDQMAIASNAENNLKMINNRMAELAQQPPTNRATKRSTKRKK
jgi:hypothetical protein